MCSSLHKKIALLIRPGGTCCILFARIVLHKSCHSISLDSMVTSWSLLQAAG